MQKQEKIFNDDLEIIQKTNDECFVNDESILKLPPKKEKNTRVILGVGLKEGFGIP